VSINKRYWIPSTTLILLGLLVAAAWLFIPDYAEKRFAEKLEQVGIETESVEFRIEGLSRPVVSDLSLRISGVNLVADSIEFGSIWDGYGADKPLKIAVNGLWAGINAQIPEGLLSVNNAILALPEESSFEVPIPLIITFDDGGLHYENRGRQIDGKLDGKFEVDGTNIDWQVEIDVHDHPVLGRGTFDWLTGFLDLAGEMDISSDLSQAIWDIIDEDSIFDWKDGRFQAAFHFEGENYIFNSGQAHALLSGVEVGFKDLDVLAADHVAFISWTPDITTLVFNGDGMLSRLVEAPFSWAGNLSIEPGPSLLFQLDSAAIGPQLQSGDLQISQTSVSAIPLEISILAENLGFDFQLLGLDLQLGSEIGGHLTSSTMDLMFNGRWEGEGLSNASADFWFKDSMVVTPMFQAEVGEGLINARIDKPFMASDLIGAVLGGPDQFVRNASFKKTNLFRYTEVIGDAIQVDWTPGKPSPLKAVGDFAGIGSTGIAFLPEKGSSFFNSKGKIQVNPGDFEMDYRLKLNPSSGLSARVDLADYPIQEYPNLERWLAGEFDITGSLSGQANFEVTPENVSPEFKFRLENILYASGNLVLDHASYYGTVDSLNPFHLSTIEPFTVSSIQVQGWSVADFETQFEVGNRINITDTTFSALGGSIELADISMGFDDMFIESEIGVTDMQTEEILQWIPKVIGIAEGSISGVIPFQWDLNKKKFSLGRGHLQSPEGELGSMNLKIFRPEGESAQIAVDERYSMVDEALSNLKDSTLDIDILPPNSLSGDTRVRLNIKGFVDSRLVKAPVDVVRYYSLPIDSFSLTMEQFRQDLPGFRSGIEEAQN
tara:strand:- start:1073 stop:3565 length:2493 start_codon:yes stop_codon:yes gene_type:complete